MRKNALRGPRGVARAITGLFWGGGRLSPLSWELRTSSTLSPKGVLGGEGEVTGQCLSLGVMFRARLVTSRNTSLEQLYGAEIYSNYEGSRFYVDAQLRSRD